MKYGVTRQIQDKYAPNLEGIHCMAHRTNLAMQTLFYILVVKCIEDLLQLLHSKKIHSLKRHFEFLKLVDLMKVKGNKILQNVRTC